MFLELLNAPLWALLDFKEPLGLSYLLFPRLQVKSPCLHTKESRKLLFGHFQTAMLVGGFQELAAGLGGVEVRLN